VNWLTQLKAALPRQVRRSEAVEPKAQDVTPEAIAVCRQLRQGDVLGITSLPIVQRDRNIQIYPAPQGVVLLSQTCDVVLPDRRTVVVAPVVRLSGDSLREAGKGLRPRYVKVPDGEDETFADLDVIATLEKNVLAGIRADDCQRPEEVSGRRFGRGVARRFGRFAFPDEVVPWLTPLSEIVTSKYGKASSGEARALESVVELRIESGNGWESPPYDLTLVVIVRAGTLPELEEDDQFVPPTSLQQWLRDSSGALRRKSGEIADRLFVSGAPAATSHERYHLWLAVAEAWAAKCTPRSRDRDNPAVVSAVADGIISADIVSDDEYPLSRYRRSERLDVEHLSSPPPI
jgi:hypothetical protein